MDAFLLNGCNDTANRENKVKDQICSKYEIFNLRVVLSTNSKLNKIT